jgi:hypothetical protein
MKTKGRLGTPKDIEETREATKELAQPHWGKYAKVPKPKPKKLVTVDRAITTNPSSR